MKRALVYSPYWDTLGGGEKYVGAVAAVLSKSGVRVEIAWHDSNLLKQIQARYDFHLTHCIVRTDLYPVLSRGSLLSRRSATSKYDLQFVVSDGSVPFMFAKHNILHFQVPFTQVKQNPLALALKRKITDVVVCNSQFTKNVVDATYGFESQVVYPPATMIPHKKKDSLILSVGRFDNLMQSKRHDVLIEAFAKLPKKSKWKLVIAGGVLHGDKVVADLRSKVSGKNIEILSNLGWEDIADLYAKASVYWHAAGYGLDLVENPEKAEHFGISTVEAMSAGAVPVVFDGGGLPEIVTHNTHGYLWKTPQELVTYTLNIIQDDDLRIQLGKAASIRAREFSTEVFEREFKKIIG